MTKSKQIVLARVRENIDWVKTIKIPHILYTFEDMHNEYYIENIGSEDGFYLQHILKNYNNLADITIFTQANPFDHCKSFIGKLLTIEQTMDGGTGYLALSDLYGKFSKGGAPHHPLNDLPLEHVFKRLFGRHFYCHWFCNSHSTLAGCHCCELCGLCLSVYRLHDYYCQQDSEQTAHQTHGFVTVLCRQFNGTAYFSRQYV